MTTENTHKTAEGILVPRLSAACRLHFIGIAGASMRGLAVACRERGYEVTGSDSAHGEGEGYLARFGIGVSPPAPDNPGILSADIAVYSLAVPADHPELVTARRRGIPTVSRADLLAALLSAYPERIGVAGTHGKSTVSAMCAHLLARLGTPPTAFVGASLSQGEDGYRAGCGDIAVFEACEYRRSFLCFSPTLAVLTSTEWDHPDCYPDHEGMLAAFSDYLALPSVGRAVVSADDAAPALTAHRSVPTLTYGLSPMADVRAEGVRAAGEGMCFSLVCGADPVGEAYIGVRGEHNVKNALAAFAVAHTLGYPIDPMALADFSGIGRRLTRRGVYAGVTYFEDYAHHPTEIRAALAALRGGEGRLIAVFQPHTYTRTAALFSAFAEALGEADCVIVTDVYAARERNESGVSARALATACGTHALYLSTPEAAALSVRTRAAAGDTVVVMGAGDLGSPFFPPPLAF